MKPTIGRVVIVRNFHSNGSADQPAVINRVWGGGDPAIDGPQAVNLCVLPDCGMPTCLTCVPLYDSREAADRYLATMVGHAPRIAHWPEREPQAKAVAVRKAA